MSTMNRCLVSLIFFIGCCRDETFFAVGQAAVLPDDITIDGVNLTSPTEGIGHIGDTLKCNASCDPPASSFQWTLLNTNVITNSDSVSLTQEGVLSYQCSASNVIAGSTYSAEKNIRVTVLPARKTCSRSDLLITGVDTWTYTEPVGNAGDDMTCSALCLPAPHTYRWTNLDTNQVFNSAVVKLHTSGVISYECTAVSNEYTVSSTITVLVISDWVPNNAGNSITVGPLTAYLGTVLYATALILKKL